MSPRLVLASATLFFASGMSPGPVTAAPQDSAFPANQNPANQNPAAPNFANQNMVTEFKGTLKGFQRGVVSVLRDDGTEVMVQLPDNVASFQFVAKALPAFLQRGSLVRFTGTFNQAGISLSPITKVELFQPVAGRLAGRARESYVPGVYPEAQHGNQQPFPAVAKCQIVGALMGMDGNGGMLVQTGKQPVRVQLADDAQFEIRYNNLNLAQEGDPVSVAGFYQPPDETRVKAERITVTTDRVYGEPSEETPKRGSRRRSRRTEGETPPAEAVPKNQGGEQGGEPAAAAEAE